MPTYTNHIIGTWVGVWLLANIAVRIYHGSGRYFDKGDKEDPGDLEGMILLVGLLMWPFLIVVAVVLFICRGAQKGLYAIGGRLKVKPPKSQPLVPETSFDDSTAYRDPPLTCKHCGSALQKENKSAIDS